MHKKKYILFLAVVILLAGAAAVYCFLNETYEYGDANEEEILYNPLTGLAPSADYEEAVGENSLVYFDILWREAEPEEGVYDFSGIYEENQLEKWKSMGKKAVMRLICDKPGEEVHMDIPDWLYDKTKGDGDWYDTSYGKGYAPDYGNEAFIAAHEKLLKAMAQEFGEDNFIAYIQLGSIGHWGEWHVKYGDGIRRLPSEEVCALYVTHYREAFPDTRLLMRRPFYEVSAYGLGVYNDMTGEPEATKEWLSWLTQGGSYEEPAEPHRITAVEEIWNMAPVGGEFTSSLSWEEMLKQQWEQTKELIADSHMTFIGPKCPHAGKEEYREEADELRQLLGYKIGIGSGTCHYNKASKKWSVTLAWNNKGTAPMYYDWKVYLYLFKADGSIARKVPVDLALTSLGEKSEIETETVFSIKKGELAKIGVGIEDPMFEQPAVRLNNRQKEEGYVCILWDFTCISEEE